jgi:ATP synthase F1 delta subunit
VVNQTLARRYAIAISSLAAESDAADRVGADLAAVAELFGSNDKLHDFFVSPVISRPDKERALRSALDGKVHAIALHAVLLLVRKRREALLDAIVTEYRALQRAARNTQTLTLTSARPLDRAEYAKLIERLERLYHKSFEVTEVVNPSLIGGVRIVVGDRRIDATISGRLDSLARELATQ